MSNEPTIYSPETEEAPVEITEQNAPKWLVYSLTTLAYGIPLAFLAYVLYINYLPFGYSKTFTIDVGAEGDTTVDEFYLEPSPDLTERKTTTDNITYRELNGIATVVFNPVTELKDVDITVAVEGEGVEIIPPVIDFDPGSIEWDYDWDFTQGKTPNELGLIGNAYPFDSAMYFDGTARLEFPDSADKFEEGPFTVYAEWIPKDNGDNFQQIVGHFNWELLQNSDGVQFQIGRVNNEEGQFYTLQNKSNVLIMNKKNSVLVQYVPKSSSSPGYIIMYINNQIIDAKSISDDIIWRGYGDYNLSFGRSFHGSAKNFIGLTERVMIKNDNLKTSEYTKSVKYNKPHIYSGLKVFLNSSDTSKIDGVFLTL